MSFTTDAITFVDTGGVEYPQLYQQVNRHEIPDTKSEEQTIEFIRCYVCGKPQRIITTLHLKTHNILSSVKKCVDILEQALMLRGCLLRSGNKSSSRIELTEPALRIKPLLIEDPIILGRTATYTKEQGTRAVAISRTAEGAEIPLDFTPHTYFNGDWSNHPRRNCDTLQGRDKGTHLS